MIREGKEEKKRIHLGGQITITLALVLMVAISLLLSMVEAARSAALEVTMECAAQSALYSLFAQYHKELAEQYDLLFIDSSFQSNMPSFQKMEEQLKYYMKQNCNAPADQFFWQTRDWYGINDWSCVVDKVRLATDSNSPSFYQQAVASVKDLVEVEFCEEILGWDTITKETEIDPWGLVEENEEKIKEAEMYNKGKEWSITEIYPELNIMNIYKSKDLLWIAGLEKMPSEKSINPLNTYGMRNPNSGSPELFPEIMEEPLQDVYFDEYILLKLGCITDRKGEGALDYQVEYVLCGQYKDFENLMKTCELLFLTRSAANMIPLTQSEEAKSIVETLSALAVLIDLPPDVTKPLIYMMWSAFEGLLDTRTLLQGGRIPLVKSYDDFQISLKGLTTFGAGIFDSAPEKGNITDGLSYKDYLRVFLLTVPRQTRITRCMDIIEANIRLTEGNEFFRIDGCVDMMEVQFSVETAFGHFYSLQRKYSYF